jgi:(4-(4-[2-(gamma-L-glutamylamino)ethyl]phenoxymethyl)furan-2-yl)methanamine synthase
LVHVLGYDVGGANTKATLVCIKKGKLLNAKVAVEYFPIWKKPEKLAEVLFNLEQQLGARSLDGVGLTMTAELSDAYQTKREGVNHILSCVSKTFPDVPVFVLTTTAELVTLDVAKQEPLAVAAANWAATGWLVATKLKNCIVVDVGSTSTSIIPIVKSKVVALGKTDLDKLSCGELVYTGSLRTNVAAILHSIPIRNVVASVASELFALSGDVNLVLGNITKEEYSSETTDGRGKTIPEALARLARVVCADSEMLTNQEIIKMAEYISDIQIQQVAEGLSKVYAYTKLLTSDKVPVVVTGLGKNFIARKAAEKLCIAEILDLGTLLTDQAVVATPAFGVAIMAASKLEEENGK